MKKLLLSFALITCIATTKAQTYVTIPDANFVTWLQNVYPTCMNGNQMDTSCLSIKNESFIISFPHNISNLSGIEYFTHLQYLKCDIGIISTIPALPSNLETFECSNNLLTTLPPLPNTLITLGCANNQLTILPSLPNTGSFWTLHCPNNQITTLPLLPISLRFIDCSNNQLTSLPALSDTIESLYCSNNNLSLLPSLPQFLQNLDCTNNLLTCLPNLPDSILTLDIFPNQINCLPNYVYHMNSTLLSYPICTVPNINNCDRANGIMGNTYTDNNNNCLKEISENSVNNINLILKNNLGAFISKTTSFANGIYSVIRDAGSYTVSLDTVNKPYKGYCHLSNDTSVVLTALQPNADSVNFSIKCKSGFDVGVQSVITNGWVFPGQQHHLKINAGDMAKWYGLNCASGVAGQMVVNVTGAVHYSTSAVGALVPMVSGNTFIYNITDFGTINNDTDFDLVFITDTTATVGDTVCVSISVTPTLGDINLANNTYHYCYPVINSYDPNKKEVYPADVLPNYHDWFTYTIHFQNTGSAAAMNIRLKDTLDANLDVSTFEVINYSHPSTWQMYNNGLVFNFQNIQLPDSTTNPEGSKGFVQYRIKPKAGMINGSLIKNTAYIYFDYNAPIITNTTLNHFMLPASLTESFINKLVSIYPNPTTGTFSIQLNSNEKHSLEVLDLTGKIVHQQIIENETAIIESNAFSNGIYTVKVSNNSGMVSKKLVMIK